MKHPTLYKDWTTSCFPACHHKITNSHLRQLQSFLNGSYMKFFFFLISEMRWFLLLMSSLHIVVSEQQCRTTYSVWGRYLKGHATSAYNVKDHDHCHILCSEEQRCQSTNFQFRNLVCELNDADRHTHPLDYEFKDGCAYSDYLAKVSMRKKCLNLKLIMLNLDGNKACADLSSVTRTSFLPTARKENAFY